jgi:hypothetical protein
MRTNPEKPFHSTHEKQGMSYETYDGSASFGMKREWSKY